MLRAACIICKKFNENSHLVKRGGSQCFPSSIQPFLGKMVEECEDLPQSTSSKLKSYVVFEKNDQGLRQLKWMAMAFISVNISIIVAMDAMTYHNNRIITLDL